MYVVNGNKVKKLKYMYKTGKDIMILTKIIRVRWHRKTKEHYDKILNYDGSLKYNFTKYGYYLEVDLNDVHHTCTVKVKLICDYCSNEYERIYRNWRTHFDRSPVKKDACSKCRGNKIKESNLIVHGVTNVMHLQESKDKLIQTNLERYGVSNPASIKEIKDKMKRTTLEKYGTEYYSQTDDFKRKYIKTMQEKYGFDNAFQAMEVKEKSKQTMLRNYGVEHNMQNRTIRQKAVISMYKRGSTPTSKPQIYLNKIYGGILNYAFERYNLDIALPKEKIDIEYNGGAHDLKVKLGGISQAEFNRREIIRGTYLKRDGWKLMKINSKYDTLPSEEDLLRMLEDAKEVFARGNSWIEFNIDNSTMCYKEYKGIYQFIRIEKYREYIKKVKT
ncbi:DUF7487 domain-containing protein [Bacillus toyonensis]|uniref:DUF7487 domain-containing protein n=1 Tax=Bacillus toyonensis TaxID=155322 RepID=UPI001EE040EF|nr:hypothetical protein [Bacillus toyonensis]UKS61501.1 hypothetical protein K6T24_06265 [Bacillus toyonensis]